MTQIFTGYLIKQQGGYMPRISNTPYHPQHEYDYSHCYHFNVKVVGEEEGIDQGAFYLNSVLCRIQLYNKGSTGKLGRIDPQTGCQEMYQHLELVVDTQIIGNSWSFNITPPVKTRGQIFVYQNGDWIDVVDMPETIIIQKKWDDYKKFQAQSWSEVYSELIHVGIEKKEARKLLEKGGIRYAKDFISTYQELNASRPPKKIIKRVCEKAYARSYLRDVLGRWISCEGQFDAIIAALEYYLKK